MLKEVSTIHFATGNKGKVRLLQGLLGDAWVVEQIDIDIPEIQHHSVEEIAREKVRTAFNQIGKPVIAEDGGLYINALGGFPGPYVKHLNETIGPEGLLKILDGVEDRSCVWHSAIAYADEYGEVNSFTSDHDSLTQRGSIATEMGEVDSERAFSPLWKIYIPGWADKQGCYLSDEECDRIEKQEIHKSAFGKFAVWLKSI